MKSLLSVLSVTVLVTPLCALAGIVVEPSFVDLGTVRVLADVRKDADARAYLDEHDTAARDRMIRRYPDLFQACSGGV